jgi:hypothetical protein
MSIKLITIWAPHLYVSSPDITTIKTGAFMQAMNEIPKWVMFLLKILRVESLKFALYLFCPSKFETNSQQNLKENAV